ncbi:hypothetical protein FRC98_09905 [Lujinxingia vulgaris]|uniref:Uncharacterized protein n=1 Tax=Lujinxingia vulgaris TaxID=2600176 RepID=A0A5C6X701_9DELT|nr:hypothetical protein [Lujinxingia vulgaris]TXD37044.1 hypothetical protein FRC98_09905 [Lujinxingia vulgaris]
MRSVAQWSARWTRGGFHLIGVLLVCGLVSCVVADAPLTLRLVAASWQHEGVPRAVALGGAIQLGLSACVWALLMIVWALFTSSGARPVARTSQRALRAARGTVITETLIVIPIVLLLIFGLAQLAINNIAGVLNQVAYFQAARTAWVWAPEPGISEAEIKDRARIAVALTFTPVAPGNYQTTGYFGVGGDGGLSERALDAREIMRERYFSIEDAIIGALPLEPSADANNTSYDRALDSSTNYATRATQKFTHAYLATEIEEVINTGGEVGVSYSFLLHQAMPLVGGIFGETHTVGTRSAKYMTLSYRATMPAQPYRVGRP